MQFYCEFLTGLLGFLEASRCLLFVNGCVLGMGLVQKKGFFFLVEFFVDICCFCWFWVVGPGTALHRGIPP